MAEQQPYAVKDGLVYRWDAEADNPKTGKKGGYRKVGPLEIEKNGNTYEWSPSAENPKTGVAGGYVKKKEGSDLESSSETDSTDSQQANSGASPSVVESQIQQVNEEFEAEAPEVETTGVPIPEGVEQGEKSIKTDLPFWEDGLNDWKRGRVSDQIGAQEKKLLRTDREKSLVLSGVGGAAVEAVTPPTAEETAQIIDEIIDLNNRLHSIPKTESRENMEQELIDISNSDISEREKFLASAMVMAKNPAGATSTLVESLGSQITYLPYAIAAGALTGGSAWGLAIGQGLSALKAETQLSITEAMVEAGLDPSNPEDLQKLAEDDDLKMEIRDFAKKRGVAIGVTEGLFSMFGMKVLGKIGSRPLRVGTTFLAENIGEGTGEVNAIGLSTGSFEGAGRGAAEEIMGGFGRSATGTTLTEMHHVYGRQATRKAVRKAIEGAVSTDELELVGVPDSDTTLKEELETKKQELNDKQSEQSGAEGEQGSEVDGGEQPVVEEVDPETGTDSPKSDNTEVDGVTISDSRTGFREVEINEKKYYLNKKGRKWIITNDEDFSGSGTSINDALNKVRQAEAESSKVPDSEGFIADDEPTKAFMVKGQDGKPIAGFKVKVPKVESEEYKRLNELSETEGINPKVAESLKQQAKEILERDEKHYDRIEDIEQKEQDLESLDIDYKKVNNSGLTTFREYTQDSKVRMLKFQEAVQKAGGNIEDSNNFYQKFEMFADKAKYKAGQLHDEIFGKKNKDSFFAKAKADGVDIETLGWYMGARHAIEERNPAIKAAKNEEFEAVDAKLESLKSKPIPQDKKRYQQRARKITQLENEKKKLAQDAIEAYSGITDEEATTILESIPEDMKDKYEQYADMFRLRYIDRLISDRVNAGLLSEDDASNVMAYKYYVPLKVQEFEFNKDPVSGSKISTPKKNLRKVKGSSKYGSDTRTNPIFQTIQDLTDVIIQSERNETNKTLLNLVKDNKTDAFTLHYPTFRVERNPAGTIERIIDTTPKKVQDGAVKVYENGKPVYIFVNDSKLRKALTTNNKNLDQSNKVVQAINVFSHYFRMINTQLSPEFMFLTNPIRDTQTAFINAMNDTDVKASEIAVKMPKYFVQASKSVFSSEMSGKPKGEWGKLYEEFQAEGGDVSWYGGIDPQVALDNMQKSIKKLNGKKNFSLNDLNFMDTHVGRFMTSSAKASEMATRLAVYKLAKDSGASKIKAANIAKNITVNFNKFGRWGPVVNSLYVFANAGVQGTTRMAIALANSWRARAFAGMVMGMGAALNEVNRRVDEDGWERVPEHIKQTNWVFMTGNKKVPMIKIPLPFGYNIVKYQGDLAYDVVTGRKTALQAGGLALESLSGAANPVHSATWLQTLSPTLLDPFAQHYENTSFFGAPIAPEKAAFDVDRVESEQSFDKTPDVYKAAARRINEATGGSRIDKGLVDVNPEFYKNYFDYAVGGIGRTAARAFFTGRNLVSGDTEKITLNQIPFSRVFLSDLPKGFERSYVWKVRNSAQTRVIPPEELDLFEERLWEAVELNQIEAGHAERLMQDVIRNQRLYLEAQDLGVSVPELKKIMSGEE